MVITFGIDISSILYQQINHVWVIGNRSPEQRSETIGGCFEINISIAINEYFANFSSPFFAATKSADSPRHNSLTFHSLIALWSISNLTIWVCPKISTVRHGVIPGLFFMFIFDPNWSRNFTTYAFPICAATWRQVLL